MIANKEYKWSVNKMKEGGSSTGKREFKFYIDFFLLPPWSNTQFYNPSVNILTLDIYFLRAGDLTVLTHRANVKSIYL